MREKSGIKLSIINIFINFVLGIIKILISIVTGSLAILTDGFNNLGDVGAGFFSFVGIKSSKIKKNGFSNSRGEYLSTFITAIIIFSISFNFFRVSLDKTLIPTPIRYNSIFLLLLIFTLIIKIILYFTNKNTAKKHNLPSINAISIDCLQDILINSVIIISYILSTRISSRIDGLMGLIISLIMIVNAIILIIKTYQKIQGNTNYKNLGITIIQTIYLNNNIEFVEDIKIIDNGPRDKIIYLSLETKINNVENLYSLRKELKSQLEDKNYTYLIEFKEYKEKICKNIEKAIQYIAPFAKVCNYKDNSFTVVSPINYDIKISELKNILKENNFDKYEVNIIFE